MLIATICLAVIFVFCGILVFDLRRARRAHEEYQPEHHDNQQNIAIPATAIVVSVYNTGFPKKVRYQTRDSLNNNHLDWRTGKCIALDYWSGLVWIRRGHSHPFTRKLNSLRPTG
jgi:heme/copper-type cytochrome/quinol oxidase subunit 2